MHITKIELFHVSVPLKHTFWPTWIPGYPQTHNKFTLIKLTTDEGIEGYSAGPAFGKERQGLGDLIGGYMMGVDPTDIERVQSLLRQAGYLGWHNYWIEPACWDIKAKAQNKAVYELLGGKSRAVELYCSTGEQRPPAQRIDDVHGIIEQGFKTIKLRIRNHTLEEDIKHVTEICCAVGDKIKIAIDANQGWLVSIVKRYAPWDLQRAKDFSDVCTDLGVQWLEEPLDSKDYDGNAALKQYSRTKITGAELNTGWDEIKIMLEKDCFDVYQPDAVFAGGIAQAKKVMDACKARGRGFSPHTWTNGIGFHINWNVVLADSENNHPLEFPLERPSWIPEYRDGIIDPILADKNGMLQPFASSGLGFNIDAAKLRKYGRRFYKRTDFGLKFKVVKEKGLRAAWDMKKQQTLGQS